MKKIFKNLITGLSLTGILFGYSGTANADINPLYIAAYLNMQNAQRITNINNIYNQRQKAIKEDYGRNAAIKKATAVGNKKDYSEFINLQKMHDILNRSDYKQESDNIEIYCKPASYQKNSKGEIKCNASKQYLTDKLNSKSGGN
jgi:hypothetical protein